MRWSVASLVLALLVTAASAARGDADRADDIHRLEAGEVLISTEDVPGRSVPRLKGIALIKAPPEKVWAVIEDCSNYKHTMPRTIESQELSREGNRVRCRLEFDMPFPFSNLWVETEAVNSALPGRRYERAWSLRGGDFRENTGSWTLEPHDGGRFTIATYETLSEPNVPLPRFIIRMAQEITLPDMFAGLRRQLE